jgi:hypothetical protein
VVRVLEAPDGSGAGTGAAGGRRSLGLAEVVERLGPAVGESAARAQEVATRLVGRGLLLSSEGLAGAHGAASPTAEAAEARA